MPDSAALGTIVAEATVPGAHPVAFLLAKANNY